MKDIGYYELWRKSVTSSGSKTRKQRRLLPDLGGGGYNIMVTFWHLRPLNRGLNEIYTKHIISQISPL